MNKNIKLLSEEWLAERGNLNSFYKSLGIFLVSILRKSKFFYIFDRFEKSAKKNC